MKRYLAILLTTVLVLPVAAGCGAKKRYECTATATYEGGTRKATGTDFDDEEKAKARSASGICSDYCALADPGVDAEIAKVRSARPASTLNAAEEAAERLGALSEPAVRPLYEACELKCRAAGVENNATFECRQTGFL